VGLQASLVFYNTGIDISELDIDKAAKYWAMTRRAMMALDLMHEKLPGEIVKGKP
jgi:hypothetical protein